LSKKKEDLRMQHAAWVRREIREIVKQIYKISDKELEELDETAFAYVVERHPDFSVVEKIERSNVNYLYNLRTGVVLGLLGKRAVSDTLMEAIR